MNRNFSISMHIKTHISKTRKKKRTERVSMTAGAHTCQTEYLDEKKTKFMVNFFGFKLYFSMEKNVFYCCLLNGLSDLLHKSLQATPISSPWFRCQCGYINDL